MSFFPVALLVTTFLLFLIGYWGRQLLVNKEGGERQAVRVILFLLLFALPLLTIGYLVLFVATIPASILAMGLGIVAVFYAILHSFYIGAKRRRAAYRNQQLSFLKGHIKARTLEKQVAEWKRNYQL